MKPTLTTIFLLCISTIALSQEYRIEIGSRTGCTGRGICTITNAPNPMNKTAQKTNNASIIQTKESTVILRVYRDLLTKEELDHILGMPITSKNKDSIQFTMEETLQLPEDIITGYKQISILEAKTYPTVISEEYVDIIIISPSTKQ